MSGVRLIFYLRTRPFLTSLLLMAGYFLFFVTPDAFGPNSFGRGHGVETAQDMNRQLIPEFGLVASILVVVAMLGWWKPCGFTIKFNKGGMKFVLVPLGFTLLILGYAGLLAGRDGQSIAQLVGTQTLASLITVTLLIGVFEETLFRGVVFMGWEQRFGPVLALFVSALIFGSFHFVNWVIGQPFGDTLHQVIHAFYIGVMYAALRLRIGSILPVIVLHGFWDATIAIVGSATSSLAAHTAAILSDGSAASGSLLATYLFSSLEPVYGLFVLWRWRVWKKQHDTV